MFASIENIMKYYSFLLKYCNAEKRGANRGKKITIPVVLPESYSCKKLDAKNKTRNYSLVLDTQ